MLFFRLALGVRFFVLAAVLCGAVRGVAGVPIDTSVLSAGYSQNFDSLPGAGAFTWSDGTTLAGWRALNSAGTFNASAAALDGTSNMADLVIGSLGTAGSTERALAYHTRLNTAPTYLGVEFNNDSGRALTGFTLNYTAEQWKESSNQRTITFTVQYRVGAVAADLNTTSGWTTIDGLAATTLNGAVGAATALQSGLVAVVVPDGSSLWVRWVTANNATSSTSSNDILAIDNVQMTFASASEDSAPVITRQPVAQVVAVGDTAIFSVDASGFPAPTYQWFHGTEPVQSATSATLTLAAVHAGQAGDYTVVATNTLGSATSEVATLTVSTSAVAPQITVEPAGATGNAGGSITLAVTATGSAPLVYQWMLGGDELPGANSATLVLSPLSAAMAGSYTVRVSNGAGAVTSAAAVLVVNLPPTITTPPAAQAVPPGGAVAFGVTATGATPFTYQWRKDGVALAGKTIATLNLSAVQVADAGAYSVVVTNALGSATSSAATLTVMAAPLITTPPQDQAGLLGGTLTLSVSAVGSGPFVYQWYHDNVSVSGATSASLTLGTLPFDAAGVYSVQVGNAYGTTPSTGATVTVTAGLADSAFNLYGFATLGAGTTGGGVIAETDAAYRKCYTPYEFVKAISDSSKTAGAVRVIEIMNDLDLGYSEVGDDTRALGNFRAHATPKLHPRLLVTGVSLIDVATKGGGLTIFSANGATLRHTCLNIKNTSNIIVRNLRFDEMWEWDEASKGDYDANDWDFIDLSNGGAVTNVWIDHCTFTKAYDGIADMKKGTQYVTFSWCRYVGDDGATNPNSFVRQQIAALEAARASYPFYNFLRNNGFSPEDIVQVIQGHDKGHLMGATEKDPENNVLSATFHHQWFENIWDRCVPRLRGGQVHNYNILVDNRVALVAKRLRDARKAAMSTAAQASLENTYSFNPFLNGSISTEGGAILVEKSVYQDCLTPLRNNQTDVNDPTYTGKIKAVDTIYIFHNANGTTTTVRGDSTDSGNPMGPFQAAVIPFSWNEVGGVLPYTAPTDDPAELAEILQRGAGAGRLAWAKSNWLKTSYPATAPTIPVQVASRTLTLGQSTTLAPVVIGSTPITYQWYRGTTALAGEDGVTLTLAAVTAQSAGVYKLVATNSAGTVESDPVTITIAGPTDTFAGWIAQWFTGADAAASADPDGDGLRNLAEFALGFEPAVPNAGGEAGVRLARVSAGQWEARYTRRQGAMGIAMVLESSTDLATWTPVAGAPVQESVSGTRESLVHGFSSAAPRLFVHLRVTQQ